MQAALPDRPRNLVTGITGFAGCFLAEALLERGESVLGLSRRAAWPDCWAHLGDRVELFACDLCDGPAVESILRRVRPTRIYHLAGYAQVGASFREPEAAWAGNLTATRQLCEAVVRWGGTPRILYAGSGLVYGPGREAGKPRDEQMPLLPDTPYAASKAAADLACYQYTCSPGLAIVRARPFNHIGPYQSDQFAIPNFARQLVAIERGECPPVLQTGNLSPQRDLTDVRDTVDAYLLLADKGRCGEVYNIGSGQSYSMQFVLERLLALTGLKVELRQRTDLLRPSEPAVVRVNAGKLRRETGWTPRFSLDQTLADTLEAWRRQAGARGGVRQGEPQR
jgi:GDP-4-dehydro-6-deoxy-D-mannose reductase